MDTLTLLITLYPTAHRAPSAALSAFSLSHLNGSSSTPSNTKILGAISRLYSVLHLTGGKVGAVNLWRKSMEETLSFGHESLFSLRSTFPDEGMLYIYRILQFNIVSGQTIRRQTTNEPQIHVPLNLDRLRCTITILCNLMRCDKRNRDYVLLTFPFSTIVQRPIQVPVGHLVKFCTSVLSCTTQGQVGFFRLSFYFSDAFQVEGFIDPSVRSMEIAIVPAIWSLGCDLLVCLAIRYVAIKKIGYVSNIFHCRLGPILDVHVSRLATVINFQLGRNKTSLVFSCYTLSNVF